MTCRPASVRREVPDHPSSAPMVDALGCVWGLLGKTQKGESTAPDHMIRKALSVCLETTLEMRVRRERLCVLTAVTR